MKKIKHLPVFSGRAEDFDLWKAHVESACVQFQTGNNNALMNALKNAQTKNEEIGDIADDEALAGVNLALIQAILLSKTPPMFQKMFTQEVNKPLKHWGKILDQYVGSPEAKADALQAEIERATVHSAGGPVQLVDLLILKYAELQSAGHTERASLQIGRCFEKLGNRFQHMRNNWIEGAKDYNSLSDLRKAVAKMQLRKEALRSFGDEFGGGGTPHAVAAADDKRKGRFNRRKGSFQGKCHNCGKKGHKKADCWSPRREHGDKEDPRDKKGPRRHASKACSVTSSERRKRERVIEALVDSGNTCSWHLCGDDKLFSTMTEVEEEEFVSVADDHSVQVAGRGTIHAAVTLKDGTDLYLNLGAWYVPGFKCLLSTKRLRDYEIYYDTQLSELRTDCGSIPVDEVSNMITLRIVSDREWKESITEDRRDALERSAASVHGRREQADLTTWHQRLAHQDPRMVKKLIEGDQDVMLTGQKTPESCEPCALGKADNQPFPKATERPATRRLQRVHMDLVGPLPMSMDGKAHALVMVDEFTGYDAVYCLAKKSEAAEKVQAYVEEFGAPEEVRSDNAKELLSADMEQILNDHGIDSEQTVAHCPQQNGLCEREIATLTKLATTVMIAAEMPTALWTHAFQYAAEARNCSLRKRTKDSTPHQLMHGVRPDLTRLRAFGCTAYVTIPKQRRRKMKPRAWTGVMMGYAKKQKGWLIMDPSDGQIRTRRNVHFNEKKPGGPLLRDYVYGSEGKEDSPEDWHQLGRTSRGLSFRGPSEYDEDWTPPEEEEEDLDDEQDTDEMAVDPDLPDKVSTEWTEEQRYLIQGLLPEDEETDQDQASSVTPEDGCDVQEERNCKPPPQNWWAASAAEGSKKFGIPKNYQQAIESPNKKQWLEAIHKELMMMKRRGVWKIVELPKGRKTIPCKWVFDIKRKADGSIERHKARLVACGYSQKAGIDYNETFAPVAAAKTFRTMLSIAAHRGLKLIHIDVKSAYLHAPLTERIFMEIPLGLEIPSSVRGGGGEAGGSGRGAGTLCCELKMALYGLCQAGREWHLLLARELEKLGLQAIEADECLFVMDLSDNDYFIAIVYVDDIAVAYKKQRTFEKFLTALKAVVEIGSVENLQWFIGIHVQQTDGLIKINQERHILDALKEFRVEDCKALRTPAVIQRLSKQDCPTEGSEEQRKMKAIPYRRLIGILVYLATCTRPDIAYAVSELGRFLENPGLKHWQAAKMVLRYLKGTTTLGITFEREKRLSLRGHCDADYAGDEDTRKSTTGYVFQIQGGAISWRTGRQKSVTLSSTEAEYVALAEATKEVVHLRRLLAEIGEDQDEPTVVYEDNQSCIALAKSDRRKQRTKHIDVSRHFIKQYLDDGTLSLQWKEGKSMVADILTKPLGPLLFKRHRAVLMNEEAGDRLERINEEEESRARRA